MSKPDTCKLRILAVCNMLQRGAPISTAQILRELELRCDISVDRKTIYDDVREINRIMPVESTHGRYGGFCKQDVLKMCEDMLPKNESPCTMCIVVNDPTNCENKCCPEWRNWFIQRWEELRDGK